MSTYDSAIPGTALIGQATLNAKTAYQKALAQINQRRSSTLRDAGYAGDIDPTTGTVGNIHVDAGNQYGQFQQIRRSHAQTDDTARWDAQERGLGTGGGLAAQQVGQARYGFGADDAAMGQGLIGNLQGLQGQQDTAQQGYDSALYQAQLDASRQAIDNGDWNPANYDGLEDPGYPDGPGPGDGGTVPTTGKGKKATFVSPRKPLPGTTLAGKIAKNNGWGGVANQPKKILPAPKAKPSPYLFSGNVAPVSKPKPKKK